MDYQNINEILEKYFEGNTTQEEENLIREYFLKTDLPVEHQYLKKMFHYFNEAKINSKPDFNVNAELNSIIDNQWKKESKIRFNRILKWSSSVAAIFILGIGIFHYYSKPSVKVKDTFSNPDQAYIETKRALLYVSNCMNKNTSNLKYLAQIDKSYKKLSKIGEMDKIVNSLKSKKP
jgi:hypothetical protein